MKVRLRMKRIWDGLLVVALICVMVGTMLLGRTETTQAAVYSGLNYDFLFDADYYYNHNSDVASALGHDSDALFKHFLKFGMKEGRLASSNFNVYMYKADNQDLAAAFGNNYQDYYTHYLRYGIKEGRKVSGDSMGDYSRVFDPNYYYTHNSDVASAVGSDPNKLWDHFVTYGMKEGRQAAEYFNVSAYKENNKDLVAAFGDDLPAYYKHYVTYGYKESRISVGSDTVYNGVDYSSVYNKAYYLANNPDVAKAFGGDSQKTLQHFVEYGMSEGRKSDGAFDVKLYKSTYKDLQKAFGNDWKSYYIHYINYGKKEGRVASTHTDHTYSMVSQTAPTCTAPGVTTYQCECGDEYTVTTQPLGHDWELISGNGSSVKTLVYKCKTCGDEYTAPNPLYIGTAVACWGDSMTYGQYGAGMSYPLELQNLSGMKTYNLGVSGETSVQIATRQGGMPMVTGDDITLQRGGSVNFRLLSTYTGNEAYIDPLDGGEGDYSGYTSDTSNAYGMCYINGQAFDIAYDGNSNTHVLTDYYNADSDNPDTIFIPAGTRVYPKASIDRANDILILEMGSNGDWKNADGNNDYNILINQYWSMINSVGCKNYIILGDTDDPGESEDSNQGTFAPGTGMNDTAWEAALRGAFGDHFLNIRTYLIQNGLSDNGLTAKNDSTDPNKNDNYRASIGEISLQLRDGRYDNTHLNYAGYKSKGIAVYQKGKTLGYWE